MKRPLITLLAGLLAVGLMFAASFVIAKRLCARHFIQADDLDWLRQEFRLSDAEMLRVRELHAGYMPRCAEMCRRIADKKGELETALAGATNVTETVEKRIMELCELRARCQLQMLRHFVEVSQAMAPEQGRRYLAEMQRLTLGFHEQIEQSMSTDGHAHGHH